MSLPKRMYVAAKWRDRKQVISGAHRILKLAVAELCLKPDENFVYRIFEGGNSVEAQYLGKGRFRERRK